jgi:hypothetical protein
MEDGFRIGRGLIHPARCGRLQWGLELISYGFPGLRKARELTAIGREGLKEIASLLFGTRCCARWWVNSRGRVGTRFYLEQAPVGRGSRKQDHRVCS